MKNPVLIIFFSLLLPILSKSQTDSSAAKEIIAFRNELNKFYSDSVESPLLKEDKLNFKGLTFYPIDVEYRIIAKFVRTANEKAFKMATTTERRPEYVKFGEVYFSLKGKQFKLNIYQNTQLIKNTGFENYLFLPFTDLTNGEETYGGGRYIDLKIPDGDNMIIDFNQCYNPYCAYNHTYSCPIPPKENTMDILVKAGVKAFKPANEKSQ